MSLASSHLAPLPWPWFDFDDHPRLLDPDEPTEFPDVNNDGAHRVYAVEFDHRLIPFKYFRKPSSTPRPLLILQHGMGLTIATFRGVAPYLFQTHDLALIDYSSLTCHSGSHGGVGGGWPAGGVPIRALAESIWPIADALRAEKFSIAGNSLGGGICLITALNPRAKTRLQKILLSNPACYPQKLPTFYRIARIPLVGEFLFSITRPEKMIAGVEFISYVDKSRFDPDLKNRYVRHLSHRQNRLRVMDMMRHLPNDERDLTAALHLPRLGEITQPVLLSWGEQDKLLVPASGPRLARDLPNCTFDSYPDLAHMPHEEAPERIGPRWAEFLQ
jgi:pimeloyl-ACP methyl ester carboxylesterase